MYNILASLYSSVKACLKIDGMRTESFMTSSGLRQGCILSPLLFIFFINELITDVFKSCKHGVFVAQDIDDIMMLLFLDDVNMFSYTVLGLQQQYVL